MNEHGWSPVEYLARLAAKGPQMSMAPGGVPRFGMEEIAGALSGIAWQPYLLARVKYIDSPDNTARVQALTRRHLYEEAARRARMLAVRREWPGDIAIYERMAVEAVGDVLSSHRCRTCLGTGRDRQMPSRTCGTCRGSGSRRHKNDHTDLARRIMPDQTIKPDAWRKTWAPRYRAILEIVQGWDDEIERHLLRRLYGKGVKQKEVAI